MGIEPYIKSSALSHVPTLSMRTANVVVAAVVIVVVVVVVGGGGGGGGGGGVS